MQYPLKNWNKIPYGYKFGVKTWYKSAHLGVDKICPSGTPVYAHASGKAVKVWGPQGGNQIHFYDNRGHLVRYMHLSSYAKLGNVNEGEVIAYTGNTGALTSAPHLHVDVSKGTKLILNIRNFINPEDYFIQVVKPAPKPVTKPVGKVYVVKRGDTMSAIARKHGLTLAQLKARNPQIKNLNLIRVGQKINL